MRRFLQSTVIGSLSINIIASLAFACGVFVLAYTLRRLGRPGVEDLVTNVFNSLALYWKYIVTVIATLAAVAGYKMIRRMVRPGLLAVSKHPKGSALPGFAGRHEEVRAFTGIISGTSAIRVYNVCGISGCGKTWLLYRFIEEAQRLGCLTAYLDFRTATYDPIALLRELTNQLGSERFPAFTGAVDRMAARADAPGLRFEFAAAFARSVLHDIEHEVLRLFVSDLNRLVGQKTIVIFFDTFERVRNEDFGRWVVNRLVSVARDSIEQKLYFVISGWDAVVSGSEWSGTAATCRPTFLSRSEIEDCLAAHIDREHLTPNLVSRLVTVTRGGHPLLVGLAAVMLKEAADGQAGNTAVSQAKLEDIVPDLEHALAGVAADEFLVQRILASVPGDIAHMIRLSAVPRWFDGSVLRTALSIDEDHAKLEYLIGCGSFVRPRRPYGYEYHELVRELLLAKWKAEDHDRYLELNATLAAYHAQRYEHAESQNTAESAAIEEIYHSAIADPRRALQVFTARMETFLTSLQLSSARRLLEEARKSLSSGAEIPWVEYHAGQLAYASGDWNAAERIFLRLYKATNADLVLSCLVANALGEVYYYQGAFAESLECFAQAKAYLGGGEVNPDLLAEVLENAAKVHRLAGDLSHAEQEHEEALAIAKSANLTSRVAAISTDMSTTLVLRGKWKSAICASESALRVFRALNDKRSVARSLRNLAWAEIYAGKWDEAARHTSEAAELARQLNDDQNVAITELNVGRLCLLRGDSERASEHFSVAMEIFQRMGAELDAGTALEGLASCAAEKGAWPEAAALFHRSIAIFRRLNYNYGLCSTLCSMGSRQMERGDVEAALQSLSEAESTARSSQYDYMQAKALAEILRAAHKAGTLRAAELQLEALATIVANNSFGDIAAKLAGYRAVLSTQNACYDEAGRQFAEALGGAMAYNPVCVDSIIELLDGCCGDIRSADGDITTLVRSVTLALASNGHSSEGRKQVESLRERVSKMANYPSQLEGQV